MHGLIHELLCHTTSDFQAMWYRAGAHVMSHGVAQDTHVLLVGFEPAVSISGS